MKTTTTRTLPGLESRLQPAWREDGTRNYWNWPVYVWLLTCLLFLCGAGSALAADVSLTSPGFAASHMDDQGRLVEDWGAVEVKWAGEGLAAAKPSVETVKLDGVTPAAVARTQGGSVGATLTAFRAPAWPAGLDVLTVRLEETAGREQSVRLSLVLPDAARIGSRTVSLGERAVLALPAGSRGQQAKRDWGWDDDARALTNWAKPAVDCDPAFRSIRAGMGGVPIHYTFKVEPKAAANVVLGLCESHWTETGKRPLVCQVEGAPPQEVDPVARWGQHQPGALLFEARDENGDGRIEVTVLPGPGAVDANPILNAIWVFSPAQKPKLDQVIAGRMNGVALRYVDVGGVNDQSYYIGGKVEYAVTLPAKGTQELTFLVACSGASVPAADKSAWTPEKLRKAAADVWRGWRN